jgi:hypothetical protein
VHGLDEQIVVAELPPICADSSLKAPLPALVTELLITGAATGVLSDTTENEDGRKFPVEPFTKALSLVVSVVDVACTFAHKLNVPYELFVTDW